MAEIPPVRNAISDLLHGRQVEEATGWPIRFADMIKETPPPSERDLERGTAVVHGRGSAKDEEGRGSLAPRE